MNAKFDDAIKNLPEKIKKILVNVPYEIKQNAQEIRLRSNKKICITQSKNIAYFIEDAILKIEDIGDCYQAICGYSIHSHLNEIVQGFVTLPGGHRAGISATAIYENGKIVNLKNISSINIRIARQIKGAANEILNIFGKEIEKLLIVGPPASGKTTIIKDIVRNLNSKQVSIVDSRGEIAAILNGVPQNDVGNADVFNFWNRKDGMLAAIKTMSPDIIVCDEIGCEDEIEAIKSSVGAGVSLIATAHAKNPEELKTRNIIQEILKTNAFETVIFLKGKNNPGKIQSIFKVGDLIERNWNNNSSNMSNNDRICIFN